ncbi:MAG: hypothetical protein KBT02_03430 [Treponema sp.]|nr:hypothetical protein [Candidatus Treponema caballi]
MQQFEQRNMYMLRGSLKRKGYDWWRHFFTGVNKQTGEQKAFFLEYFVINPARSPQNIVMGNNGENKPSYVMVKAGTWGRNACQICNFYPSEELHISKRHLEISVGSCCLSETMLAGKVETTSADILKHPEWKSDAGCIAWNLKADKKITQSIGKYTNWIARNLKHSDMYWHAQGMKTEFSGFVIFNGIEYIVTPERSYGCSDKFWGKNLINPWIWLSSNHLVSQMNGQNLKNSAISVAECNPARIGKKRRVMVCFVLEGKKYEFISNGSKKNNTINYSFFENADNLHLSMTASNRESLIDIDIFCPKTDALSLMRENPMGISCFQKLWNCGNANGKLKLFKKNKKALEILEDAKIYNCGFEIND